MDFVLQLIAQYGLLVVFLAVLLEQGGLPVPAYPVLIVASSLAFETGEALWPIVGCVSRTRKPGTASLRAAQDKEGMS